MLRLRNKKLDSLPAFFFSCKISKLYSSASDRIAWDPTVSLRLEHHTLVLLEKCSSGEHFKQILAQMMRMHLVTETFPMSRLLCFSAVTHPEFLNEALTLFDHFTPSPNLYIYNIMISALSSSSRRSTEIYNSMLLSSILPNEHTFLYLLKSSKHLTIGKQIHAHSVVYGYYTHTYLQNSLCKMYIENGQIDAARKVARYVSEGDDVSRNIMISGYAKMGLCKEAFGAVRDAMDAGIELDQYAMVSLLLCCKQVNDVLLGKSVHGRLIRKVPSRFWGLILRNALLDMYAKCADMASASKVFDSLVVEADAISWNVMIGGFASIGEIDTAYRYLRQMPHRDVIAWNSLLAGCTKNRNWECLKEILEEMLHVNTKPDKATAMSLLGAAAEMGVLNQGRCVHGMVAKFHDLDAFLGSALIDMYCKCGSVGRSRAVFEMVGSARDVAVWTAMISGLAFHGHGAEALLLFDEMQREGLKPNGVTLLGVMAACSHAGFADEACSIFGSMEEAYGVDPGAEHYGCLVDVLARTGRLPEAMDVIRRMPLRASSSTWGCILRSAKAHGDLELAETALGRLVESNPEEEGGYVMLSNVYAACGKWSDSDRIREAMDSRGVKKAAGCSTIDVDGVLHHFVSSDRRHRRRRCILFMLYQLHSQMMLADKENLDLCTQQIPR